MPHHTHPTAQQHSTATQHSTAVYPRLSWISHLFDIQRTARKSQCHAQSCRLPALVFDHFDFQNTARESHCVSTIWDHRKKKETQICFFFFFWIFCTSGTPWNNSKLNSLRTLWSAVIKSPKFFCTRYGSASWSMTPFQRTAADWADPCDPLYAGLHIHTVDDSVQYIEDKRKTRRGEINTGRCWTKFSEFKSLESSDSVQRIEGCQGDPGRTRNTTGKPEGSVWQVPQLISTPPDRFAPFFESGLVVRIFSSVLVETGRDQSCPVSTVHHIILSAPNFARQPITMVLIAELPLLSKKSFIFHIKAWSSLDLLCDVDHFFVAQSQSGGRISLVGFDYFFSLSQYFHVVLLKSLCISLRVESHLPQVFCCVDPCFDDWFAAFGQAFSLFHNLVWGVHWCHLPIFFLVAQSLCWSCILSWVRSSILQLSSTIFHSVMLLFSAPVSIFILFVSLRFQHRIFALSIFSMASSVLHYM